MPKSYTVIYIEETYPAAIWAVISEEMKRRQLGIMKVHVPLNVDPAKILYPGCYGYTAGTFIRNDEKEYCSFFVAALPEKMLS